VLDGDWSLSVHADHGLHARSIRRRRRPIAWWTNRIRFDFLTKPSADSDAVVACFFKVNLTPVNGTSVVRTFSANDTERAISFGIVPLGDDGMKHEDDAKIRANTALVMRFPTSWTSAIESVTVSSVGVDTLLAVVRDTPEVAARESSCRGTAGI
jgi:hypothetical protein